MNLNQVTVPVNNIKNAVDFYQTLGLKLIVLSPHYARFECPNGESTFSIHLQCDLPQGQGVVVYFEVENLDEYVEKLIAKNIVFQELPNDKVWLWREAHLFDCDGNKLIFFYAGENRKNPPWRVE